MTRQTYFESKVHFVWSLNWVSSENFSLIAYTKKHSIVKLSLSTKIFTFKDRVRLISYYNSVTIKAKKWE
jgi:hypothetical protein